ncbi:MAG: hypothetical protein II573_03955, partial [Ruminococcus sp.]|nr:hypothetical protein [Ruminococcus sp.]
WAPVTGATQYTVYFKSASSASWRSVTTDENEIVLTNANQGTLYSVQVRPLFSGTPVCIPRSQASSPKSSRSCFFDKPIIKQ